MAVKKYDKRRAKKTLEAIERTEGRLKPILFGVCSLTSRIKVVALGKAFSKLKDVAWETSWESSNLKISGKINFRQVLKGGMRLAGKDLLISGPSPATVKDALNDYFKLAYTLELPWTNVKADHENFVEFEDVEDEDTDHESIVGSSNDEKNPDDLLDGFVGDDDAEDEPEPVNPLAGKPATLSLLERRTENLAREMGETMPKDEPDQEIFCDLLPGVIRTWIETKVEDLTDEEARTAAARYMANLLLQTSFTVREHAIETEGRNAVLGVARPPADQRRINLDEVSPNLVTAEDIADRLYEDALAAAKLQPVFFSIEDCNKDGVLRWVKGKFKDGLDGEEMLDAVKKLRDEAQGILKSPRALGGFLGIKRLTLGPQDAISNLESHCLNLWHEASGEYLATLDRLQQNGERERASFTNPGSWRNCQILKGLFDTGKVTSAIQQKKFGDAFAVVTSCIDGINGIGSALKKELPNLGVARRNTEVPVAALSQMKVALMNLEDANAQA